MQFIGQLTRLSLKQQTTYRTALYAGLATNLFFGLLRAALMIALYAGKTEVNQLTLQDAITYVGLTQGLIAFLMIFGSTDIMQTVYSGQIGSDLLKPINLYTFWLAKDAGKSLVNLAGRGVLFMLVYGLFFKIALPESIAQWILLLISLALCWLVSFSWRFLVNLAGFWSPDARGVARIGFTVSAILSGFIMPLPLMPGWFIKLCYLTPFPSMVNTPVEIYLGVITTSSILNALGLQLVWLVFLALACQVVLRAGVRRLVIQGG
jgi:ABC-2 type transport system permease protein